MHLRQPILQPWLTIHEWIGLEEKGCWEGPSCLILHQVAFGLQSGRWLRVVDPSPSVPISPPAPWTAQNRLQLSQLCSPSQQSNQGQMLTGILERCRIFFPAVGRNQTLLKLVVLPSAEFLSGISQQRNLLPHPMSLSNMDWVPSPRS